MDQVCLTLKMEAPKLLKILRKYLLKNTLLYPEGVTLKFSSWCNTNIGAVRRIPMIVRPRGTTGLPPIWWFSWNFPIRVFFSGKYDEQIQAPLESDNNNSYFTFLTRSVLLIMRKGSDKSCIENQNTHFVFSNFFF